MNLEQILKLVELKQKNKTWNEISKLKEFAGYTPNALRKTYYRQNIKKPKVKALLFDIETAPLMGYFWNLFDQTIPLNQIEKDWHVLSYSAKWLNDPPEKIYYKDQRKAKNVEDDKELLKGIWKLLDEADVVITQNGKKFDVKKLNARFIENGFKPPSSYRHIDTMQIAKKHFAFTSNKLEYLTNKLCTKYKKLKHEKFSGFTLWKECIKGNKEAWNEMEKYNKYDVLSLEEVYHRLQPWDKNINFNVYSEELEHTCNCGSSLFLKPKNKFYYTNKGKYQKLICVNCGKEHKERENLLSKLKRQSLKS